MYDECCRTESGHFVLLQCGMKNAGRINGVILAGVWTGHHRSEHDVYNDFRLFKP